MKLNAVKKYLIALCGLMLLTGGAVYADETQSTVQSASVEPAITTNLDIAYVTKYLWRGLVCNPDPAIQPSLTISHKSGLSLNIWGSLDTTDFSDNSGSFTEHDYTLDYAWSANGKSMDVGYAYYCFPNTSFASTSEIYVAVGFEGKYSPTITAYYDVDEANGLYVAMSACHEVPLTCKNAPALCFTGKLGFASSNHNQYYFAQDKSAFVNASLDASMPITVNDKFSITPGIGYSMVIDNSLRDAVSRPDNLVGSLTISYAL